MHGHQNNELPNHGYLLRSSGASTIHKVDIFVEPSRQSGPKMTLIGCISMKRQVPYNECLSEIFENLDVDYQMLIISGQY